MKSFFAAAAATMMITGAAYAAPVDLTAMNLNGSAFVEGTSVVLTPSSIFKTGSAFINSPFAIDSSTSFSSFFEIEFSENGGFFPAAPTVWRW